MHLSADEVIFWQSAFININLTIVTTWVIMLLMTIGEMIAFPFSNAFAMSRAKKGNQGEYMALYSIAFSVAHIFGHNSGMQLIDNFGYNYTWYIVTVLMLFSILFMLLLMRMVKKEKTK